MPNDIGSLFTQPGRQPLLSGMPYPERRKPYTVEESNIDSAAASNHELGQQASVDGTATRSYKADEEDWPSYLRADYQQENEAERNWYGGQYPSIAQGGLDINFGRRDIGGLPGSVDANTRSNPGPVNSDNVEDFTLYGDVLRLVRPNVAATGPVIGGRDWRTALVGQLSQVAVDVPLTVDTMRLFLTEQ
jgi:hypothetical protein